ncbi:uncharacterized protein LOC117526842 isoform X3 [Thalassophryne amazonica]|uniref:uncharacterized protein LOC117526842 isoform X3 n=1 Tax=Thalassophryne amazonica TaxID=390379 RepID=UPI001471E08C|nr:uncharacterized protein LOC117526842 isoform X3 [Thalassophryne amazonica]
MRQLQFVSTFCSFFKFQKRLQTDVYISLSPSVIVGLTLPVMGRAVMHKKHRRDSGQQADTPFNGQMPCNMKEMQNVTGSVGQTITLRSGVTKIQPDNLVTLSRIRNSEEETLFSCNGMLKSPPERFGLHLHMDTVNITIDNLNSSDAGLYRVQIFNGHSVNQCFNLTVKEHPAEVSGDDQQSHGRVGLFGTVGVVVVAALISILVIRRRICADYGQRCPCFRRC